MNKYTKSDIKAIAAVKDAVGFERFCKDNNIEVTWLDVNLSNFNEDYYNVELPEYNLCLLFCDGKFEEAQEL